MSYHKISQEDRLYFQSIVGESYTFYSQEILKEYSHDETEDLSFIPELVVKPQNTGQISDIMRYCNLLSCFLKATIPILVIGRLH